MTKSASSLGNLNPFFLKAQPKSLSSGGLLWQVVQEVRYLRANAGMVKAGGAGRTAPYRKKPNPRAAKKCIADLRSFSIALSSREEITRPVLDPRRNR